MRGRAESPRKSFVALQLFHRSKRSDRGAPGCHQLLSKVPDSANGNRIKLLLDFLDRNYAAISKEVSRDLLRTCRGTLEAHKQPGAKLSLGTPDFLGVRCSRQQGDLINHQPRN